MNHPRNLCTTVEAKGPRYETLPCEIGWAINPATNGGRTWTWCHQWPGADRKNGHCINCGKTLKQVRVLINPKRSSRLARDIANTPADVPPVTFVGKL